MLEQQFSGKERDGNGYFRAGAGPGGRGARLLAVRLRAAAGDGDEQGAGAAVALAQGARDFVAGHLRHADVEQN